jgi:membrane associated rhomboid family serine protease
MGAIMGLADRQYMRDPYNPPRASTTLIVVLIVAFVIQSLLLFYARINVIPQLALSVEGLREHKIWQLLTFQFLHVVPIPIHVLCNCVGLYFFGRPVEEMLGTKRFLVLYFLAGTFGGLFQVGSDLLLPRHNSVVFGASAGVCGMIAIFCSIHPMQELTTWIYFFPVNIRARTLLIGLTLLSIFGTLIPIWDIAHGAHLGGILLGMGYVRWGERLWGKLTGWRTDRRSDDYEMAESGRRGRPWRRNTAKSEKALPPDEYISREIDPILDKISAHGIHALTDKERKILEAARKKMGR